MDIVVDSYWQYGALEFDFCAFLETLKIFIMITCDFIFDPSESREIQIREIRQMNLREIQIPDESSRERD